MNILDFAIQMEKDGEAYYRELAGKSAEKGIQRILTALASAEVKHQQVLQAMKQHAPAELTQGTFIEETKTLFASMIEAGVAIDASGSQVDLYKKAQELEEQSRDFYRAKAEAVEGAEGKALFEKLAAEEQSHYLILDSVIDFVSRPVSGNWLENAEWHHSEDY